MEELRYLGEIVVLHDPSLRRAYQGWVRRKSDVLALSEMEEVPQPGMHGDGRGFAPDIH
jgi:hypothetical protein